MNGGILVMDNGQVMVVGSPTRLDIIVSAMESVMADLSKREKDRILQMAEEIKNREKPGQENKKEE